MKATRRDLVLRLLRAAGARGVTTSDLLVAGVGSRYSARLLELRERGYTITSERERQGQWRYRLIREPGGAAAEQLEAPAAPASTRRRRRPPATSPAQIGLFDEPRAA